MEFFSQIMTVFSKGGLVMYPLLLCSVLVIAIALERSLYLRNSRSDVNTLLTVLAEPLTAGDWEKAGQICENSRGVPAQMLAEALSQPFEDRSQLEQILDGVAAAVATLLRCRLDYLETIVTLAPLLGLLGTVTGMILSFNVLSLKQGQPLAITGGVGEALIATATGLTVAIAALIAHSYLSHRINAIIADMEKVANHVVQKVPRRAV
ncbi:MotA/TolQ/ExbB proton channel family protein [Sporomusa aerivorans]|uniref:MotA/TolQ/ExbB proton channel family protein n=1 Tax=Sporomusa aerivorans TaxID=204936 RepID=UPI00352AB139